MSNLTNYRKWSFLLITYIASCVCIFKTNATQGILVFCLSNFIVVLLFLRIKAKAKTTSLVFAVIGTAIGSLVVLGIFQIGPLSQYLYKRTVSLRGSYWNAAYETGKDHMFAGVGFDAFGDWYRRSRSEKAATWLPGPDVVVNAAHNYFLDFFASGGILLFAIFSVLNLFAILSAVRIIRTLTTFEVVPIILISAYFGFLAQSLVSISQIGVGVWNWILIGALIGFSQITETSDKLSTSRKKISANINQPIGVFIFIGMSVGFTLSVPPFSADVKWMNALKSQDIKRIELALQPSYFNPSNSFKYGEAISLLERNKFFKEAHVYSLASVSFNPELYELWRTLYFVTNSTPTERNTALKNMKRLDPLNSKLRELK